MRRSNRALAFFALFVLSILSVSADAIVAQVKRTPASGVVKAPTKTPAATGAPAAPKLSPEKIAERRDRLYLIKSKDASVRLDIVFPDPKAAAKTPGGATPGGPSGAQFAWSKLISAEILEKEIQNNLDRNGELVKSLGTFGKGVKDAKVNLTVEAILCQVASQYDREMKWKGQAAGVRDLLASVPLKLAADPELKPDDAMFNEAKTSHDAMVKLLKGEKVEAPAGADRPWHEVAGFNAVMTRLDVAQRERLKPWLGSEGDFKTNKDKILHEASVLAVMSRVIQDKAYGSADEEDFQAWAKLMEAQAIEIVEACKTDQFAKASAGITQITKACADCHDAYRGN